MKMLRRPFFLAAALLAALPAGSLAAAEKTAAPVTIFIVRHGEKSAVSGDVPLSDVGRTRAGLLARMMQDAGVTAVFSSELAFAQETAAPVAAKFNLKPVTIPVRETDRLVAELEKLPPGAVAFVVNHSGQIGELVQKLGGARPSSEATGTFNRLWVVSRQPGGPATVAELRFRETEE